MKKALFCAIAVALATGAMAADKKAAVKLTDAQLATKAAGTLYHSNYKQSGYAQAGESSNTRASVYCRGNQCTSVYNN